MKTMKLVDFRGQVLLIGGCLLYLLFIDASAFMYAYFLVGGWQVASMIVHLFCRSYFYPARDRKRYQQILFWMLVIGLISIPFLFLFLFGLLIISPVLAVWYAIICNSENRVLAGKEFVHLK